MPLASKTKFESSFDGTRDPFSTLGRLKQQQQQLGRLLDVEVSARVRQVRRSPRMGTTRNGIFAEGSYRYQVR